jgi:hypothetical protein
MERKGGLPDLLVVVIDGNLVGVACGGARSRR